MAHGLLRFLDTGWLLAVAMGTRVVQVLLVHVSSIVPAHRQAFPGVRHPHTALGSPRPFGWHGQQRETAPRRSDKDSWVTTTVCPSGGSTGGRGRAERLPSSAAEINLSGGHSRVWVAHMREHDRGDRD